MECECNYHKGMGPNLLCPMQGKREDLDRRNKRLQAENEKLKEALEYTHCQFLNINTIRRALNKTEVNLELLDQALKGERKMKNEII